MGSTGSSGKGYGRPFPGGSTPPLPTRGIKPHMGFSWFVLLTPRKDGAVAGGILPWKWAPQMGCGWFESRGARQRAWATLQYLFLIGVPEQTEGHPGKTGPRRAESRYQEAFLLRSCSPFRS